MKNSDFSSLIFIREPKEDCEERKKLNRCCQRKIFSRGGNAQSEKEKRGGEKLRRKSRRRRGTIAKVPRKKERKCVHVICETQVSSPRDCFNDHTTGRTNCRVGQEKRERDNVAALPLPPPPLVHVLRTTGKKNIYGSFSTTTFLY